MARPMTRETRSGWSSGTLLVRMAVPLLVVAAATVAWEALHVHQIAYQDHCGYDGTSWCRMAQGGRGDQPYQRRFLLSLVVRGLHFGNVVTRFVVVNLVACVAISVLTGLLTHRFARALGAMPERAKAAAIAAAALTGMAVYPWRYLFMIPVNTDIASAALVLAWLLAATSTRERVMWLTPLIGAASVMTRDMTAPALVAAALVVGVVNPRHRAVAAANVVAMGVAALLTTLMPAAPGTSYPSVWFMLRFSLKLNFGSVTGIVIWVWLVCTGVGLTALLAVPLLRRARQPLFAPAWTIVLVSGVVASTLGGTPDRYVLPAMVVLTAMAAAYVAYEPRWDAAFLVLSVVSVCLWRPWLAMSGETQQILDVYNQYIQPWAVNRRHLLLDLRNMGIGLALSVFAVAAAGRLGQRRPGPVTVGAEPGGPAVGL